MVDTDVLGASGESREGSTPSLPTIRQIRSLYGSRSRVVGPYLWRKARRYVVDVYYDGRKHTMLLARLRLEIKLRRRLLPGETVDHVDGDCTNDNPDNLQPLSLADNARKALGVKNLQDTHEWMRTTTGRSELSARSSGVKNGNARLTETQVFELRSRERYYGCVRDWMEEFSVSRKTIQNVLNWITY